MRGLAERFGRDPDAILAEGVLLGVDGGWVSCSPTRIAPYSTSMRRRRTAKGSPVELMEEYVELVKSLIQDQAMLSS